MLTRPEHLNEMTRGLEALKELIPALPMDARWGAGEATARHIAFHISEAADFWLRNVILGDQRPRDRDAEFTTARDKSAIIASINAALAACAMTVERAPALDAPVAPPATMTEGRPWTVLDALLHITAHTTGHVGELTVVAARGA